MFLANGLSVPFSGLFLSLFNAIELAPRFLEARAALKDCKRKGREQARKARLLVTAVAAKIEEKDEEMERVSILVGIRNFSYIFHGNKKCVFRFLLLGILISSRLGYEETCPKKEVGSMRWAKSHIGI